MADASFSKLRSRQNLWLRDSDDFTFTAEEKDETLRAAIEDDAWVYRLVRDNSQTFVTGTYTYDPIYDEVDSVWVDQYSDGRLVELSSSAWDEIGGELLFDPNAYIPSGAPLWIYGKQHFTKNDQIPQFLQGYVVHNACAATCDMLVSGKVNRFLRNEATMAELQISRTNHLQAAAALRRTLHNRRSMRF